MENFSEFDQHVNAPTKNFSDIISHAFNNYLKVIGWGILMFVIFAIISSIVSSIFGSLFGYDQREMQELMQDAIKNKDFSVLTSQMYTVHGYKESQLLSSVVSLGLYPLYAGFMYILQKGHRGNRVNFSDLLIGYRQNTGQIILYGLISGIITIVSFALCFFPILLIWPLLFIGLPIVFFENTSAVDGIKKSFAISSKNYGTFFGINFIAWVIAFAGILLCGIGLLATVPFIFAASYSTYCAYCGTPRQLEK